MIIVQLIGGLGNQMFQYAAAKALSLEKKQPLVIDSSSFTTYKLHQFGLHHFALDLRFHGFLSKIIVKINKLFKNFAVYNEDKFSFNPSFLSQKESTIYLKGYFQSELYFKKYSAEIRSDFQITAPLKDRTNELLHKMKLENAVSIHIRRGDYLHHEIHNTNKTEYYKLAMQYIESNVSNPVYYLFSDDMHWVKANFKTNFKTHFVDFNDASSNYEDLKLMSSCKHNIIANSSFSWWSAWLNVNPNKIVVAPQKWFNDTSMDYSDVLPESWIKL